MRTGKIIAGLSLLLCLFVAGCRQGEKGAALTPNSAVPQALPTPGTEAKPAGKMTLTSPAFVDGQTLPTKYTADGDNMSPPLAWDNVPKGTQELALICEDPDAPGGDFVHWIIAGIPPTATKLPEGLALDAPGYVQGRNDFGVQGYKGPDPPPGKPHHYRFRLLALDKKLDLPSEADKQAFRKAIEGHVIAEAQLIGLYQR